MRVKYTNVEQFEKDIAKFIEYTQARVADVAGKLAFDAFDGVTTRTPVDTGYARGQWKISQGSPDYSREDEKEYKAGGGAGLPGAKGRNSEEAGKARDKGTPEFPTWYITNNVPYIIYLEQGRSKQIGKGYMVTRTINDLETNLHSLIQELEAAGIK